jgi:hypothetical protein
MKVRAFVFDSAYQVVTWVLIAVAIAALFLCVSKGNHKGILWSAVALLICVEIMVALIAERYIAPDAPQLPSDRPWLSVEVMPDGPITFQNGTQATIPIKYRLTNMGRAPANDVRMKSDIVFPVFGSLPIARQRQIAQQPRAASLPFSSGVVFEGAPVEYRMAHIVSVSQMMEFATEEMKRVNPDVEWTRPYIVGCINYTFGQSAFSGETGFIYEIQTRSVENPKITLMLRINVDVPEERLVFEKHTLGGDYAK